MLSILNNKQKTLDADLLELLLYGYGVYTAFVVENTSTRYWTAHLDRICGDAAEFIGMEPDPELIMASVIDFLEINEPSKPLTCRVTVFPEGFNLASPHICKKLSILVTGREGSSVKAKSLNLKTFECKRSFTQHKVTNIASAMHIRAAAKKHAYDDALICNDGIISEGPTWNIFFLKDERIITPPINSGILPGVTRKIFLDHFHDRIEERSVTKAELQDFDGAFITNAAIGAVPVSSIDALQFEKTQPLTEEAIDYYRSMEWQKIA